ncbi:cytidylyltransferase domain-containing protein [Shewanella sp.]|uniref:cytidylyltransferase domain-containing protein n=1 Tax=Shewanella sp. TaxID=50422 RepID=UPI0035612F25
MAVICVTQARIGSTRLPAKVLMDIEGIPLIAAHCNRVARSRLIDRHILAIADTPDNAPLQQWAESAKMLYAQGSELDVLSRFYLAAQKAGATEGDTIVRLTGDCPLVAPELIDAVIEAHLANNAEGYTYLDLGEFPRGFDTEVFPYKLLAQTASIATSPAAREHVTFSMYSNGEVPLLGVRLGKSEWREFRLCVDEADDLALVRFIASTLGPNWLDADGKQICALLMAQPDKAAINSHVKQKTPH